MFVQVEKICPSCNEKFIGRSDKKFCSDKCRSRYHYYLLGKGLKKIRQINSILRRNWLILQHIPHDEKRLIAREIMEAQGFNFNFVTSINKTPDGEFRFCYDEGYQVVDEETVQLMRVPVEMLLEKKLL
jgi:hypothetical protein